MACAYSSSRLPDICGQLVNDPESQGNSCHGNGQNDLEQHMTKPTWKSILLIAAVAAGASLGLAETAEAAKMSCIQKYRLCNQRCAGRSGQGDWTACINRTCNRQYDNCASSY